MSPWLKSSLYFPMNYGYITLARQPGCLEALDQSGSSSVKHSRRMHVEDIEEVLGQFILEEEPGL